MLRKLKYLIPDKYFQYYLHWCRVYCANAEGVAYLIIQTPGFSKFIDTLVMSANIKSILIDRGIKEHIIDRILEEADLLYDISQTHNIVKPELFTVNSSYEYEYKYSKKYKCIRCGHPCDYQEIQIRRGDEESDLILFCTNCGLQQRRNN